MENTPEFQKYGKLPVLAEPRDLAEFVDRDMEIFEKIDGGNCQVRNMNWRLFGGSRANFLKGARAKQRPWFERFLKWMYSNETLLNLPENVIMFGEWSGNHSIVYDRNNTDKFYLIDVMNLDGKRFMGYGEGRDLIERSGVEGVRFLDVLAEGRLSIDEVKNQLYRKSDLYDGHREGLVIKDYKSNPQLFLKLYHPDTTEMFPVESGGAEYLTPSRFVKGVFRLIEEGGLENVSRRELVDEIVYDVMVEGGVSLREEVVRRCMKEYLDNGDLDRVKEHLLL